MSWKILSALRPGAVFMTEEGILALKTEYHTFSDMTQCDCYLLESGEAAHFPNKDTELVKEIPYSISGATAEVTPPEVRTLAIENHRLWQVLDMIQSEARSALRLREGEE